MDERNTTHETLVDHEQRIRSIETLESPYQRQLVTEVQQMDREIRAFQAKVTELDMEGTHITQVKLASLNEVQAQLRAMVVRLEDKIDKARADAERDAKANRRAIMMAIIAGVTSLGVQLIILFVTRAAGA